jgi:hypothetical protein
MRVYMKLVMIMEVEYYSLPHPKISHCNIHKFTLISPDGKIRNQIDHILIDRRRHSSVYDVRSFMAADLDADHYLVVKGVRGRLAVSKQGTDIIWRGSISKY